MISTRTAIPIRQNVSSALKTATNTVVPARVPVPRSRAQFASMRKLQAQNCADPFDSQRAEYTAPTVHTYELVHKPRSQSPKQFFPSRWFRSFRSSAIRSSLTPMQMHQRAQSHAPRTATNWLRNQLTCLGLVPRVHTLPRHRCPSRRVGSRAVCACRCALPPAVSPLGRAPCSVALPSLAG